MIVNDFEAEFDELTILEDERELVRGLVAQLTEGQINRFNLMYGGVDVIKYEDMRNAYTQCKMAIRRNNVNKKENKPRLSRLS